MRKLAKYGLRALGFIAGTIALYFIAGVALSFWSTSPERVECMAEHQIFVSSNGVHLDIVLHTSELDDEILNRLKIPAQAEFVTFGWGDRGFYLKTPTWSDLKFSVAFNALFLRSESAMHVDYHYRAREDWKDLPLCRQQLETLKAYILKSFATDAEGDFIRINFEGYNRTDAFYEARASYNLIMTCNEWVNLALKKAGVKTSIWSPFEFGVIHQISSD